MGKELVLALFESETVADEAVRQIKEWDKRTVEVKLGAVGVLVKDDKGKIQTHKLGARRTAGGAVLFALAGLLSGGMTVLGGAVLGGILGSIFRKGLGIPKAELAELDGKLDDGRAAVGLVVNPDEVDLVTARLVALGGAVEAHEIADEAVDQAVEDARVAAPAEPAPGEVAPTAATVSAGTAEQVKLAAEAFLYGYPLVYGLHEIDAFARGGGRFPVQAPYNAFGHVRALAGPEFKFVSPNNDTCYSIAACDVGNGPLVLEVPDTHDRYYVLQFVDAWSNNFAYIGRRATGTKAARYLLAPAGYDGKAPEGMQVVHTPTGIFIIVGRLAVDGAVDLPVVHALQDALKLTPLSVYQGAAATAAEAPASSAGIPGGDERVGEELEWWERFRVLLQAFPPPEADAPFLQICRQLGLLETESPFVNPDPAMAAVLVQGAKAGQAKVEELMMQVHATPAGWQNILHLFDYNLDYFEVGALDDPAWKIEDRTKAYATRAVAARAGLWGNHGYEAVYSAVWVDGDGQKLDCAHQYELYLKQQPPVDAFWSLTMYDVPEFYLVGNPINRYSIGDRTPGLRCADDGSLTIYIQRDSPGPDKESNWLPTPESGVFRPLMRLYQPKEAILDGSYALPAIKRLD
jgi:hypothetical protein